MNVWEEEWRWQAGGMIVFPDGEVDVHVDGEPPQRETESGMHLHCDDRARLASAAPDMVRVLLALEWSGPVWGGSMTCPICGGIKEAQHRYIDVGGCSLHDALLKAGVR